MEQTRILLFFAAFALGGILGCPDQADIDKVNSIAQELGALANNLPDFNFTDPAVVQAYKQVLNTLCTTYKNHLYNISLLAGACPQIILHAQHLTNLTLLGKGFIQLYANFADVDEFCVCSPHLVSAWIMDGLGANLATNIQGGVYETLANAAVYCNLGVLSDVIADLSMGLKTCRPLWKEAGLTSSQMISDISEFMNESCSGFDESTFQCAVGKSSDAKFVSCMNNAGTTTVSDSGSGSSDLCDAKCCGQRSCVKEYIAATCGASGRDIYIDAVNLQRPSEKYLISKSDCPTDGATVARTSLLATLGISLLFFIF